MKNFKSIFSSFLIIVFIISVISVPSFAAYTDPSKDPSLFDENFASWDVETGSIIDKEQLETASGGKVKGSDRVEYILEADGSLNLKALNVEKNAYAYMYFKNEVDYESCPGDIKYEVAVKDEKVQVAEFDEDGNITGYSDSIENKGNRSLQFFYDVENEDTIEHKRVKIIEFNDIGGLNRATGTGYYGNPANPKAVVSDGYYSFKIVLHKENITVGSTEYNWTMNIYDKNNNDAVVYTHYYTSTLLPKISGVAAATYLPGASLSTHLSAITIKNPIAGYDVFEAERPGSLKLSEYDKVLGVKFTRNIDQATLSGIRLLDSERNDIVTRRSAFNNEVALYFTRDLIVGEKYTLAISDEVMSVDGENIYPSEFEYTVVEQDAVLFEQDFSSISGTYTPADLNTINPQLSARMGIAQTYEGMSGYLKMTPAVTGAKDVESITFNCNSSVYSGTVAIDMKLHEELASKLISEADFTRSFKVSDRNGNTKPFLRLNDTGFGLKRNSVDTYMCNRESPYNDYHGAHSEDNIFDIRFIFNRNSVLDPWTVAVYDLDKSDSIPVCFCLVQDLADFSSLSIEVYRNTAGRGVQDGAPVVNAPVSVQYVKIYYTNLEYACGWGDSSFTALGNVITWSAKTYGVGKTDPIFVLAVYDANDNLIAVNTKAVSGIKNITIDANVAAGASYSYAKVFMVNSYAEMKPLMECLERNPLEPES